MLPALINCTKDTVPQTEQSLAELKDKISGIWNSMVGMGSVFGPIMSGVIVSFAGFRSMCDILALVILVYGVIFFKYSNALAAFKELLTKKPAKEGLLLNKELDSLNEKTNPEEILISNKSDKI